MKYILLWASIIIAIFIFALSFIPIGIEPLTEVYFENHTTLPKNIFPNKEINFSFSIHNLEYISMKYAVNTTLNYQDKIIPLDYSEIWLANNKTQTFSKSFKIAEHFDRAKINIHVEKLIENKNQRDPNLKNRPIDIHFWVDEIKPIQIIITPD